MDLDSTYNFLCLSALFSVVHVNLLVLIINAVHLNVRCLNVSGKKGHTFTISNFENKLFTFKPYHQQSNDTVTVSSYGSFVVVTAWGILDLNLNS